MGSRSSFGPRIAHRDEERSGDIVKNINKARDDENVKGIVLRVNSPGGDVYASSMITNALEEFQATGRPVITSMGDIAASGKKGWYSKMLDNVNPL